LSQRVPIAKPRSGAEIDEIALRIIKKFQPEALHEPTPFEIERFFECELENMYGVSPDYRTDLPLGIYGYTDSEEMVSVISSGLMDDPRQLRFARSTMAHETGHALIHVPEFRLKKALLRSIHDKEHVSLRLHREANVKIYMNPEWQAWRFAGAILMPAHTFILGVKESLGEKSLANAFMVNPAFVRTRARALKIRI